MTTENDQIRQQMQEFHDTADSAFEKKLWVEMLAMNAIEATGMSAADCMLNGMQHEMAKAIRKKIRSAPDDWWKDKSNGRDI